MEDLLKPENVKLLTQLVLPGFLIAYVRGRLLPNRRVELKDAIIGYVALSFLYQGLLAPFAPWLDAPTLSALNRALISILASIVLPAALGLLLGLDGAKGWTRRLLDRFGAHLSHPVDTAWDWRLGQEECWVMAVLKDGTQWAGHLGQGSFMSSDPAERDIYIDAVYLPGEGEARWTPKGSGVWIAQGELQSLELWPHYSDVADGKAQPPNQRSGGMKPAAT